MAGATSLLVVGSLTSAPASAASLLGSTFVPVGSCPDFAFTNFQETSPAGTQYTALSAGVITSWQFQAGSTAPTLEFKVFRPLGGSTFTVVGESAATTPPANALSSYPVRIPVRAGDHIGFSSLTGGLCAKGTGDTNIRYLIGDAEVGSTQSYTQGTGQLDIAARLEADADADGFGDETQDQCSSQATTHGACDLTAPRTTIVRGPTETTRRTVKFSFQSNEAGSVFECRLKVVDYGLKKWQSCTSPKKYKRLPLGVYEIQVRATDPAGNRGRPTKQRFKILEKD